MCVMGFLYMALLGTWVSAGWIPWSWKSFPALGILLEDISSLQNWGCAGPAPQNHSVAGDLFFVNKKSQPIFLIFQLQST